MSSSALTAKPTSGPVLPTFESVFSESQSRDEEDHRESDADETTAAQKHRPCDALGQLAPADSFVFMGFC